MIDLPKLYKFIDEQTAAALKREGKSSPCSKGCFFCCKEAVYATQSEVLHLLAGLSQKELARIRQLVSSWIRAFWKSGMQDEREPNVFKYREFKLWCPLLKDGQ